MDGSALEAAAVQVAEARLAGRRLGAVPGPATLEEGYAVQAAANARLESRLGRAVGHKIGGTNKAMQVYLGCDEPLAGAVFEKTVFASGARLTFADYLRPGIETEIAVQLARPLPPRTLAYSREEVAEAVGEVMAAIELVDDRYTDFRTVGAPTIVADNAFNAASVLGRPVADGGRIDLGKLRARTFIDDELVAEGTSDALLGHPLEALRWLAELNSRLGRGLEAGSFVSLGSITPAQWLQGPGKARIEVEGLGEVELTLA